MNDRETILCRCEDLTREMILDCIKDGCRTIDEIKRRTRAGMGPCQGRTCRMLIAQELANYYRIPMEEVILPTFRPPTKPVTMGALADAYAEGLRGDAAVSEGKGEMI